MKLPKIVSNKYVLYIVLVLAIINAVSLLNERDYDSLLLLSIVGLLSSYFTKNMVVVLVLAMSVANFNYIQDTFQMGIMEGMENKDKSRQKQCWREEKDGWKSAPEKYQSSEEDCPSPMCWAYSKDKCGKLTDKKQGFGQRNLHKAKDLEGLRGTI